MLFTHRQYTLKGGVIMDATELQKEINKVITKLNELDDFMENNPKVIHSMESEHTAEAIRHLERIYIKSLY